MPTGNKITPAERDNILALRKQGLHWVVIARKTKRSKSTVERVWREAHKPDKTTEAQQIHQAIEELRERLKMLTSREVMRRKLLKYCIDRELNRADLKWVHENMPKDRLTKKDRLARLARPTQDPP